MKDQLLPLIIAMVIGITIRGIAYLVPDYTQRTDLNESSRIEVLDEVKVSLDYMTYIKALPFDLSDSDLIKVSGHFDTIASAYLTKDTDAVKTELEAIESILLPYWFKETVLVQYINIEVDDQFLLSEDLLALKEAKAKILDAQPSIGLTDLFRQIGDYNNLYYVAVNKLLTAYYHEIKENTLIALKVLEDDKISKLSNDFDKGAKYSFDAFASSRAFVMTDEDYGDLYMLFVELEGKKANRSLEKIHELMSPYWFKPTSIDNFIPIDIYRKTSFTNFDPGQVLELNEIYKSIKSIKKDQVKQLFAQIDEFNFRYGKAIKNYYYDFPNLFDLKQFEIEKNGK